MSGLLSDILEPGGVISRRLGDQYEFRPQQLEMAQAVQEAFEQGHHLLVEAGTGVGKSFAYLLPAIDLAVRLRKRVVISTHTISLQEQLIHKDIPLLQSVYPDEFTAVLVKGRGNYLCRRRLERAGQRQFQLFDESRKIESLQMIEQWADRTGDGSLSDLPDVPDPSVWDKVRAEQGNCMGKRCKFYEHCFWQAAKRRMHSGNLLIVNHALFFSDLALRAAGVNYLPKYDLVVLDEAHTIEETAAQHFGMKITETGVRYQLRWLYDPAKGRGMLSTHGAYINPAIDALVELHERTNAFFDRCAQWQERFGRGNGRIREKEIVENDLSPKLRDLVIHLKAALTSVQDDQERLELTNWAGKMELLAATLEAILSQTMEDAVYWMDVPRRFNRQIGLHAAPVNVAEGLKRHLFGSLKSVVLTSATLCTGEGDRPNKTHGRGTRAAEDRSACNTGVSPMPEMHGDDELHIRQGAHLPQWEKNQAVYAVTFRLADSMPKEVLQGWRNERDGITATAKEMNRPLSSEEVDRLKLLHSEKVEKILDAGHGDCWLRRPDVANLLANGLKHFDGDRYHLVAWCIMPNHVHLIMQPTAGYSLSSILHSIKSWTAKEANRQLQRSGPFWQVEYYDHLVRNEQEFHHCLDYLWENPQACGLHDWQWRGRNEHLIAELLGHQENAGRQSTEHGQDARDTTRATEKSSPFAYIRSRVGLDQAAELQLGSPFDYEKQATLYIEAGLPEPNDRRFLAAAGQRIVHYLKQTNGGAFVLFTSYQMLIEAANRLKPELDALGLPLLVQGQKMPRNVLLERFRTTPDAVLFGTASFWQGIDVQGQALRNVIIVKLPFAVPDEPLVEARLDAIAQRGGNAFMEYSVPEAIIKLKQGFGRLIRSRGDRGIVVLLDGRVVTKRYGKKFLKSLPPCRQVIVKECPTMEPAGDNGR